MYITSNNFFSCKQELLLCCFIIPVLCFPYLPLRILYFPCYVEKSLDFKLERILKKKIPRIFQSILCRMNKWNFCLSTNVLLFDDLTILVHNFVLLVSILSQKGKFMSKKKQYSVKLQNIFFVFYVGWAYILRVLYSAVQSSI